MFILKCLKTSAKPRRAGSWNIGIEDIRIGQKVLRLTKKLLCLFRGFALVHGCQASDEYAE